MQSLTYLNNLILICIKVEKTKKYIKFMDTLKYKNKLNIKLQINLLKSKHSKFFLNFLLLNGKV